jgi:hypothetical protein
MEGLRGIESQLDNQGGSPKAVVKFCAIGTRVEEHIHQKPIWSISQDFNVDFLSGRVAVKKEPRH